MLLLHLAVKAFAPAPVPFPLLHVDTGHNFPEVLDYRDRLVERHGLRLVVASVQDAIDAGQLASAPTAPATRCRPCRCSRPSTSTSSTRSSAAAAATRRRRAPRSGSSPCATTSASGTRAAAPRAVDPLERPARAGRARARVPAVELDRARRVAVPRSASRSSSRRSTSPTSARCSAATACGCPRARGAARAGARRSRRGPCATAPSATCPAPAPSSPTPTTLDDDHRRGRGVPADRARRHPRRRPDVRGRHGRPQARGVLLMAESPPPPSDHPTDPRRRAATPTCCASRLPAPSTTASPRWSVGCSTTPSRCSPTSSRPWSGPRRQGLATPDLALLTDGLRSEREQGITIDVAYRYFATPAAQVRPRRHPRPRAVHAQHGHRRVDRRARRAARRRPQRRHRADPPARRRARAAGRPAPGARGQQDRPRRLRRGDVFAIAKDFAALARSLGFPDDAVVRSRSRRCAATTSSSRSERHPLVRRPDAARGPGVGAGTGPTATRRSASRCST